MSDHQDDELRRKVETWPIREAYFAYKHLPEELQQVSGRFYYMAQWIVDELPNGPEKTVALRKLLEAKDAAVRAELP